MLFLRIFDVNEVLFSSKTTRETVNHNVGRISKYKMGYISDLYDWYPGLEARRELLQHLHQKLLVLGNFSHLHDTDNCRLNEQLTVLFNVLVCQLLLDLSSKDTFIRLILSFPTGTLDPV